MERSQSNLPGMKSGATNNPNTSIDPSVSKLLIPNISIFAWRIIHNWIPVDDRLKQKGITLVSKCYCCEAEETIPHLFLHNEKSLEAWGFFATKFQVNIPQSNDVSILIQSWKNRDNAILHIRDIIPVLILWNIWNLWKDSKHRGMTFKANTIICRTLVYLHNLHRDGLLKSENAQGDLFAVNSLHIPLQPRFQRQIATIVHWKKPQERWHKLNTDGASRGNPGVFRAGGILRDHLGRVIFAFQEPLGATTKTQAELRAVHRGLKICRDKGFHKIWIETDATVVIRLISTPRFRAWNLQTTLQSIQNFSTRPTTKSLIYSEKAIKQRTSSPIKPVLHNNIASFPRKISQKMEEAQNSDNPPPKSFKTSYAKVIQQPEAALFQHVPVRAAKKTFEDDAMRLIGSDSSYKGEPGNVTVWRLNFKHVLIRLSNEEDFSRIWLRSEWTFDSFHMRVFKWTPNFDPQIESPIAPVWIRLPALPVHLFEKNALFTLATKIGKPLRMDEPTADLSRPVARVCVEIDVTSPKVQAVHLQIEGKTYRQQVIYENCPPYCSSCNHLGLEIANCIVKHNNEKRQLNVEPKLTGDPPSNKEEARDLREIINHKRKGKNVVNNTTDTASPSAIVG
ncbi:UNVERIFIED_CONTAM: putative ribonuclease H protein [Sesamum calycinum]|uniref:Ribonuclease H protein n=1 Tax=Sesamum calycinum TaxID=2727403 RepID=A0AAW2J0Z5_9LAMI